MIVAYYISGNKSDRRGIKTRLVRD